MSRHRKEPLTLRLRMHLNSPVHAGQVVGHARRDCARLATKAACMAPNRLGIDNSPSWFSALGASWASMIAFCASGVAASSGPLAHMSNPHAATRGCSLLGLGHHLPQEERRIAPRGARRCHLESALFHARKLLPSSGLRAFPLSRKSRIIHANMSLSAMQRAPVIHCRLSVVDGDTEMRRGCPAKCVKSQICSASDGHDFLGPPIQISVSPNTSLRCPKPNPPPFASANGLFRPWRAVFLALGTMHAWTARAPDAPTILYA